MRFTKQQLILIAVAGIVLVFVLIGIMIGFKKDSGTESIKAKLEFWGVFDERSVYEPIFTSFKKNYPGVEINYRGFTNADDYESALLDGLAAGKGPDIFMISNRSLPKNSNKIMPLPAAKLSLVGLRNLFPQTVEADFAPRGAIYALPLSIDTLALFYNRELFDKAAITSPPKNWEEFEQAVIKLVRLGNDGSIARAGAAMGGSAETIANVQDIISLLMLQNNVKMVSNDFQAAAFNSPEGQQSLRFYTDFADPKTKVYTWNDSLKNSVSAFSEEFVAMIFDYASAINKIKAKNSFLNFAVAQVPQIRTTEEEKTISFPYYWGYTVSKQSRNQDASWDFVVGITTNKDAAKNYLKTTKRPPALRSLVNESLNDPEFSVFAKQSLTARSWPEPDPTAVAQIFSEMVQSVINKETGVNEALQKAEEAVSGILKKRF